MLQPKAKKESLKPDKEKMALLSKTNNEPDKTIQPHDLSIDEVIKQVINHHIGIMM
ncbi:MAG: hypothetical protein J7L94_05965 [Caldisericaceae bacterium]|nr:hypothetical protein [Caldisericaceae bacterium]